MVFLTLLIIAILLAAGFNIWLWPFIENALFGQYCTKGKIVADLVILFVPLGLVIGGLSIFWKVRTRPMILNRKMILVYLITNMLLLTGTIWFIQVLMDFIFCLRFMGWSVR